MDIEKLKYTQEKREKGAFYASDTGKPLLDLYFAFKGVDPSNAPKWYDTLKWAAGSGVEDAIVKIFKSNGYVAEDYDQKEHGRISIEREGIKVNGYIDAIMKTGIPIEVKSINNANKFDIKRYEEGFPRENYVGQLSVYMDALGVDTGHLFVSSIDGLNRFWFDCKKIGYRKFQCANTIVDLNEIYLKWAKFHKDHIEGTTPPDIWEYRYKIPVDEIDWKSLSKSKIGDMRNGRCVLGDWQLQYSPYKDMIVKMQGDTLGYTEEEMVKIMEASKGFTTWK